MTKSPIDSSTISQTRFFKVSGMTCPNCEAAIKNLILKINNSAIVKADYVQGIVSVKELNPVSSSGDIIKAIEKAGYSAEEIGKGKKIIGNILPIIIGGVVILVLSFIASRTGILNNIPEIRESMSYPILFVVGLMTSVHCIGMCGGINLSQTCSVGPVDGKNTVFRRGLAYNLGRLTSYTVIGGIVGGIGSVLSLSFRLQGIIIIAAGIIMIIMGFNMIGLFSILKKFVPVMPSTVGDKIRKLTGSQRPFVVGLLNGFMPCGPLQSMQIYALSTGSILKGALSMFLFSAGTIPLMLLFGTVSALFSKKFQKNILKISALLIIALGAGMISRGLSLNGIILSPSPPIQESASKPNENKINAAVAKIQGDVQVVTSDVGRYAYEPIIVQAGIPVQWYLEADSGEINGCNDAIVIPKFGIQKGLVEGKTLVEFTPVESGSIAFSCWMGMINSSIRVVEDLSNFDPSVVEEPVQSSNQEISVTVPDYTQDDIGLAVIEGEIQSIDLILNKNGYTPAISVMQKGLKTQWNYLTEEITDKNGILIFPTYNVQLDFSNGEPQSIMIEPQSDFYYYSSGGDYLGFVIVVDDLEAVDNQEVLDTVKTYIK